MADRRNKEETTNTTPNYERTSEEERRTSLSKSLNTTYSLVALDYKPVFREERLGDIEDDQLDLFVESLNPKTPLTEEKKVSLLNKVRAFLKVFSKDTLKVATVIKLFSEDNTTLYVNGLREFLQPICRPIPVDDEGTIRPADPMQEVDKYLQELNSGVKIKREDKEEMAEKVKMSLAPYSTNKFCVQPIIQRLSPSLQYNDACVLRDILSALYKNPIKNAHEMSSSSSNQKSHSETDKLPEADVATVVTKSRPERVRKKPKRYE